MRLIQAPKESGSSACGLGAMARAARAWSGWFSIKKTDEHQNWRNALINIHQQAQGRIPKELIERIRGEAGESPLSVSLR
ncbi:MAG: hypothetical protein ACOYNF_19280 [Rhodoferax sp.]